MSDGAWHLMLVSEKVGRLGSVKVRVSRKRYVPVQEAQSGAGIGYPSSQRSFPFGALYQKGGKCRPDHTDGGTRAARYPFKEKTKKMRHKMNKKRRWEKGKGKHNR